MEIFRSASPPLVLTLVGLFGPFACGGAASPDGQGAMAGGTRGLLAPQSSAVAEVSSGAGGSAGTGGVTDEGGAVGESGLAGAGGTGTALTPVTICPVGQEIEAPTLSTDCQVVVRTIDPTLTCASAACAITKALDLTCATVPSVPQIAATANGAVVMAVTGDGGTVAALPRLLTVDAAGNRIEDVLALTDPSIKPNRWILK